MAKRVVIAGRRYASGSTSLEVAVDEDVFGLYADVAGPGGTSRPSETPSLDRAFIAADQTLMLRVHESRSRRRAR